MWYSLLYTLLLNNVKWNPGRQRFDLNVKIVSIFFIKPFKNGFLTLQILQTSTVMLFSSFSACWRASIFLRQSLRSFCNWDTRWRFTALLPSKRCTSAFSFRMTSSLESSSFGSSCCTMLMEKLSYLMLKQVTNQAWLVLETNRSCDHILWPIQLYTSISKTILSSVIHKGITLAMSPYTEVYS